MNRAAWNAADAASLVISATILAGILLAPWLDARGILPEGSVCLSQNLAGIECPGCGLTRSFIALGKGDLGRSLSLNWIAPTLALLAALHLGARLIKLARPVRLRTFDLSTIVAVIVVYLARAIEIWM